MFTSLLCSLGSTPPEPQALKIYSVDESSSDEVWLNKACTACRELL